VKTLKIPLLGILFILLFNNFSFAQYGWESAINLELNSKSYTGGDAATYSYDVAYDNYGVHVIALNTNLYNGGYNSANYFLIGNNGEIIEQIMNIGGDFGIIGVCLGTYKGKVYVVTRQGVPFVSTHRFKVYEKVNGTSGLTLKLTYTPTNYGLGSMSPISVMNMAFLGENAFITFDKTTYSVPPIYDIGYVGLIKYRILDNAIDEIRPVDEGTNYRPGLYPNITATSDKVHIVYTLYSPQNGVFFVTRGFNGTSFDLNPRPVGGITNIHGEDHPYMQYKGTRASIVAGKNPQDASKTNLYLLANIDWYINSQTQPLNDVVYKITDLETGTWSGSPNLVIVDNLSRNKNPGLIFDNNSLKAGFLFTQTTTSPTGTFLDHKFGVGPGNPTALVFGGTAQYFDGGSLRRGISGDVALYANGQVHTNFTMVRRADDITGNITYNTLLTGNEFINKSGLPTAHSNGAKIIGRNGSYTKVLANTDFYIDGGGSLTLQSGSTLELESNCNLIIEGSSSSFNLLSGASIKMGLNSKIIVRNEGVINAQNITFNTTNNPIWQGIELSDAGSGCVINGCTFNNANVPVKIINSGNQANYNRTITYNTFNLPSQGLYCMYVNKCFSMLVDHNNFNCANTSQTGLYINNTPISNTEAASTPEISEIENVYSFNITNNKFSSGMYEILAMNFSVLIPYYISGNIFNYSAPSTYGMVFRLNRNDLKSNIFFGLSTMNALVAAQTSNVKLFNNEFRSNNATIVGSSGSTIQANTILQDAATMSWNGGVNKFYSANGDNVLLTTTDFVTDNGYNCFTKAPGFFHIYGSQNTPSSNYACRNNYWNGFGSPPNILISNNSGTVKYAPTIDCPATFLYDSYITTDVGYGIIDTTYISSIDAGTPLAPDEIAYAEGYDFANNQLYVDAVTAYKDLITSYPESQFLNTALGDLYSCVQNLDTNLKGPTSEPYRDALYSSLKVYLLDRINSGLYSAEFNDNAYYTTIICDANINKYQDAMDGYSFIALYNPDPDARVQASWDAATIEALMNQGGSESENSEASFSKRLKRMEEISNTDPTQRKLKASYQEKMQSQYADKEKISKSDAKYNEKVKNISLSQIENKIYTGVKKEAIDRTKKILMSAKTWSKEQREQEQIKDIIKYSGAEQKDNSRKTEIVNSYSLSQNYPNPFNPVTNIKYSLPKSGFVSLKVFDVTGKMIKELVNEVKEVGNYSISFDASQFSSGVYFYRMETNNFIETKRMVLVK
jgi:hypothetical protein